MTNRIRVGLVMGGESPEHEVSLLSANNIQAAIDKSKFDVSLIGILKTGEWRLYSSESKWLQNIDDPKTIALDSETGTHLNFKPGQSHFLYQDQTGSSKVLELDVIVPILHGPFGEDGSVQGLLKMLHIPFVGCDLLSSAICMDKAIMKKLLCYHDIQTAEFLDFKVHERAELCFDQIKKKLGLPFFVKPANLGSSVGITKVSDNAQWEQAIDLAFKYDFKIIVEKAIVGREIECAILGNHAPMASKVGEVFAEDGIYSYESKYLKSNDDSMPKPPQLSPEIENKIQQIAIQAYKALDCEGLARVDFFLTGKNEILVNELNTFPGFRAVSQYPQLWNASGVNNTDLITKLIDLALERTARIG